MDHDQTRLVLDAAQRLSDMANSVAGFAISSSLLLIFACLKDLSAWVARTAVSFYAGILVGACVYVASVWYLHYQEIGVLSSIALPEPVKEVDWLLAVCRSAGIVFFSVISALAVWGTRRDVCMPKQ